MTKQTMKKKRNKAYHKQKEIRFFRYIQRELTRRLMEKMYHDLIYGVGNAE